MKKICFYILLAVLAAGCKKTGDGTSNTLLLTEVLTDSHLMTDYIYSSDKKLVRYNEWGTSSGLNGDLIWFILYEYGPGGLVSKRKFFNDDDELFANYVFTHDNSDRLSRIDYFNGDHELNDYRIYEYDQQGRISKYTTKDGTTNKATNYIEYTYDAQGLLVALKYYAWSTDKFVLGHEFKFTPAGKNVYDHWRQFMMKPDDFFLAELTSATKQLIIYNAGGDVVSDYTITASDRQYNGSGYLVKQTLTTHYVKPVKPDVVTNMEYRYKAWP